MARTKDSLDDIDALLGEDESSKKPENPKTQKAQTPRISPTEVPDAATPARTKTLDEKAAEQARAVVPKGPPKAGPATEALLTAGQETLRKIPGVGEKLAEAQKNTVAPALRRSAAQIGDDVPLDLEGVADLFVVEGGKVVDPVTRGAEMAKGAAQGAVAAGEFAKNPEKHLGPGAAGFMADAAKRALVGFVDQPKLTEAYQAEKAAEAATQRPWVFDTHPEKRPEAAGSALEIDPTVRQMAESLLGEKDKNRDKLIRSFLDRDQQLKLNAWGYDQLAEDTPEARQKKNDLVYQARAAAVDDLVKLATDGPLAPFGPITRADLPTSETARTVRAFLPQTELGVSGQTGRTEGLGEYALNMLSVPEFLASAGIDPNTDWKEAVRQRKDFVTLYLEQNPEVAEDLASGDGGRVTDAITKIGPVMAASIAVPDPSMLLSGGAKVAEKYVQVTRLGGHATEAMIMAARRGARGKELIEVGNTVLRRGLDAIDEARDARLLVSHTDEVARAVEASDSPEKAAQSLKDPAMAAAFRDRVHANMAADPDVAAYLRDTQQPAFKQFPEKWVEPEAVDVAAEQRKLDDEIEALAEQRRLTVEQRRAARGTGPAKPGEDLTPELTAQIREKTLARKALADKEAAMRGFQKVDEVYRAAAKKAARDLGDSARGVVPIPKPPPMPKAPPAPKPPVDVAAVLGDPEQAHRARKLATASADPRGFVQALAGSSETVRNTVAARVMGGDPATAYERLKNLVRRDTGALRTRLAQTRDDAAKMQERVTAFADRIAVLRAGPENAAKLRASRQALAQAQREYDEAVKALAVAERPVEAAGPSAEVRKLERKVAQPAKASPVPVLSEQPAVQQARARLAVAQEKLAEARALAAKAAEAAPAAPAVAPSATPLGSFVSALEGLPTWQAEELANQILPPGLRPPKGESALDRVRKIEAFDPAEAQVRLEKLRAEGKAEEAARLEKTIQNVPKTRAKMEDSAKKLEKDVNKFVEAERKKARKAGKVEAAPSSTAVPTPAVSGVAAEADDGLDFGLGVGKAPVAPPAGAVKLPTDVAAAVKAAEAEVANAEKNLAAVEARESKKLEAAAKKQAEAQAVAKKLADEKQAELERARAAHAEAAAQASEEGTKKRDAAIAAAQDRKAMAEWNVREAKAQVDAASAAKIPPAPDRAALAIPEVETKMREAQAAAQKLQDEADALAWTLASHPSEMWRLEQDVREEGKLLASLADDVDAERLYVRDQNAVARTTPAAPPPEPMGVIPPEQLRRELAKRAQAARIQARSAARAHFANIGRSIRDGFTPNHIAATRSLHEQTVDLMSSYDGALAHMERLLARAVGEADLEAAEMAPKVREFLKGLLQDGSQDLRRAAGRHGGAGPLRNLAALAYVPSNVRLAEADALSLRAILDAWSEGTDDVTALREALLRRTRQIQERVGFVATPPQYGDAFLGYFLGLSAAQHGLVKDLMGVGTAMSEEAAILANNAFKSTSRSAEGFEILSRAMADQFEYRGNFKRALPESGAGMLEREEKALVPLQVRAEDMEEAKDKVVNAIQQSLQVLEDLDSTPIYAPRAVRDRLARNIEAAIATYAAPHTNTGGIVAANYYKQALTRGIANISPRYMFNNKIGDFDQMVAVAGWKPALKASYQALLSELLITQLATPDEPGSGNFEKAVVAGLLAFAQVPLALRIVDKLGGKAAGTTLNKVDHILAAAHIGGLGREVSAIMDGAGMIRLGRTTYNAADLYRVALKHGVFEVFLSEEFTRSVVQAMGERKGGRLMQALAQGERALTDTANLIATRRKVGLFAALIEQGMDADRAGRVVKSALYDYSNTLHPYERGMMQWFVPFWTYSKNNYYRTYQAFLNPEKWTNYVGPIPVTPGYRVKALHLAKKDLAQVASFYLDSSDEFGYDVNSMTEEPDPSVATDTMKKLREEGMSDLDAQVEVRRRFLNGDIPSAAVRYKAVLDKLRAEGMTPDQMRAYLTEIHPDTTDLGIYYAPDPVRSMIPSWADGRYVIWRSQRRSQALAAMTSKGVGRYQDAGDDTDFYAIVADPNGEALGDAIAVLSLGLEMERTLTGIGQGGDPSQGPRVKAALRQFASDPLTSPAVSAVIGAISDLPSDMQGKKVPASVGAFLKATMPNSVVEKKVQVQGEGQGNPDDKYAYEYTITPDGVMPLYFLGLASKGLLGAGELGFRSERVADDPVGVYLGQRRQSTSPSQQAYFEKRGLDDKIEKFLNTNTSSVAGSRDVQGGVPEMNLRHVQKAVDDFRAEGGTGETLAAKLPGIVETYRREGIGALDANDIGLVRAVLLADGGGREEILGMKDRDVMETLSRRAEENDAVAP